MKKITITVVALFLLLLSSSAMAGYLPYPIDDLEEFMERNFISPGNYEVVNDYDFTNKWAYTAIAFESGNVNWSSIVAGGTPTFTTADPSNFGEWKTVDFNEDNNIYLQDNYPQENPLDPFSIVSPNTSLFRVYKLTIDWFYADLQNDNHPLYLEKGTFIVGFNDNGDPVEGDTDFDDIILAMRPVPEPATMLLFGVGLLGLVGVYRKKN